MEPNNQALTFEWINDLKSFYNELISTTIFSQSRQNYMFLKSAKLHDQNQSNKGVLYGVPQNILQIYRRIPMTKCDLNKAALQLYWNRTLAWVFSCKFGAYFQNTFPKNTSGRLFLQLVLILSYFSTVSLQTLLDIFRTLFIRTPLESCFCVIHLFLTISIPKYCSN